MSFERPIVDEFGDAEEYVPVRKAWLEELLAKVERYERILKGGVQR